MKHVIIVLFALKAISCNSFKYGYTQNLAFNSYNIITNDKKNFGNKRLKYNTGHHTNTALPAFLKKRGYPDFIFEFEDAEKKDGIHLYYTKVDSVYIFKEQRSNHPRSTAFIEGRHLTEYEKMTWQNLLQQKK